MNIYVWGVGVNQRLDAGRLARLPISENNQTHFLPPRDKDRQVTFSIKSLFLNGDRGEIPKRERPPRDQPAGLDQINHFRFPISWLAAADSSVSLQKWNRSHALLSPILGAGVECLAHLPVPLTNETHLLREKEQKRETDGEN